jgi:hypothetical protein
MELWIAVGLLVLVQIGLAFQINRKIELAYKKATGVTWPQGAWDQES